MHESRRTPSGRGKGSPKSCPPLRPHALIVSSCFEDGLKDEKAFERVKVLDASEPVGREEPVRQ